MILPFDTTLFTLEDEKESSVNYLGVGEYVQFWTDRLFPQFTVLTNNPREHGILCAILNFIHDQKLKNDPNVFRDFEAFWGLLLSAQDELSSPLNVTKYKKALENTSKLSLKDIKNKHGIYKRLGYGLFGFYINPSIKWGLVNKDRKTLSLAGNQLANYYLKKLNLESYLLKWKEGEQVDFSKLSNLAEDLRIDLPVASLNAEEASAWKLVLSSYLNEPKGVLKMQIDDALWKTDIRELDLGACVSNADIYQSFFFKLATHYREMRKEELSLIVQGLQSLEQALSICEFIFDFEYLSRSQYKNPDIKFELESEFKETLVNVLRSAVDNYQRLSPNSIRLFPPLTKNIDTYDQVVIALIDQHCAVQGRKNKVVYMDQSSILSVGEINQDKLKNILITDHKNRLAQITYEYRKDFHFLRFLKYYEYMC
mgnify:CR=1 FL=1|tara:strand:- start:6050 stop:7327 length:1278 start_codon:yes stop_codon:yes gene_type:complete